RNQAAGKGEALEGEEEALVIGRWVASRVRLRDPFHQAVRKLAPGINALVVEGYCHTEHAALPERVEHELAVLTRQSLDPLHVRNFRIGPTSAAGRHTYTAVGAGTRATPIIASRLTISASSASLRPSVPDGRSGRTI